MASDEEVTPFLTELQELQLTPNRSRAPASECGHYLSWPSSSSSSCHQERSSSTFSALVASGRRSSMDLPPLSRPCSSSQSLTRGCTTRHGALSRTNSAKPANSTNSASARHWKVFDRLLVPSASRILDVGAGLLKSSCQTPLWHIRLPAGGGSSSLSLLLLNTSPGNLTITPADC